MAVEPVIDALKLPSHVSEARKVETAALPKKVVDPGDILESKLGEWDETRVTWTRKSRLKTKSRY
jgi:hypothetical protein